MVSVIARKTLPVDNRLAESLLELRNKSSYAGLDSVFANSRGRPRSQQNVMQRYLGSTFTNDNPDSICQLASARHMRAD